MSENNVFGTNQRFKSSVDLINTLPQDKFPLFLQRLIQQLDQHKNGMAFSETEQIQLQNVFKLNSSELQNATDCCIFIFEQAAYYALSREVFAIQLEKSGVATPKITAFEHVWGDYAVDLISKLRKKTICPQQLDKIGWQLHLQMSQSSLSKLKEPVAILNLNLASGNQKNKDTESIVVEFTHDELCTFFNQLETIQEQLDNLG